MSVRKRATSDHKRLTFSSGGVHPGVHASHAVEPATAWKLPATQLTHVDALSWSLNVPGAQSVGVSEPTEQNVPLGQITQSLTLVITVSDASL